MTAKIISLNASMALLARIEAKAADIVPLIIFGHMVEAREAIAAIRLMRLPKDAPLICYRACHDHADAIESEMAVFIAANERFEQAAHAAKIAADDLGSEK